MPKTETTKKKIKRLLNFITRTYNSKNNKTYLVERYPHHGPPKMVFVARNGR